MRRLNVKLVVGLVVGTLFLGVGVYFLHAFQVDRNADDLLVQAERALAKEPSERNEAIKRYTQYLQFRDDAAIYSKLSEVADVVIHDTDADNVNRRRAYDAMEEAVRRHPELAEARERLMKLMMEFRNWDRAIDHIEYLKQNGKTDVELDLRHAVCLSSVGKEPEARRIFAKMVGYDETSRQFDAEKATAPNKLEAYTNLAALLKTRAKDSKGADLVLDQMVAVNDTAGAYIERGHFWQAVKDTEKAKEDYRKANELDPENADAILMAAQMLGQDNKIDEAYKLTQEGLQKHPKNESLHLIHARLLYQQKKVDEAIEALNKGMESAQDDTLFLIEKAEYLLAKNEPELVVTIVGQLRKLKRVNEAVLQDIEARLHILKGEWKPALALLQQAEPLLAADPVRGTTATLRLAQCYDQLSQTDLALEAYMRVLKRDSENVPALIGAGKALDRQGKTEQSVEFLQKADKLLADRNVSSPHLRGVILYQMINEQVRKPKDQRDSAPVDTILAELLKEGNFTDLQKAMMQADLALYKGEYDDASKRLMALRKDHAKEPIIYVRLYELTHRQAAETSDEAQRASLHKRAGNIISVAQKEVGDTAQIHLVRINHARRETDQAKVKEQLQSLESGIEKFKEDEQVAVWQELGGAYYQIRSYEDVQRCWDQVAQKRPDDVKITQTRFEVAREFGDEVGMAKIIEEVKQKLGADSSMYSFMEAARLAWEIRSQKKEKTSLADARRFIEEARRNRAEWHELSRIEAEIEELDGNLDSAISHYRTALEQGPNNPAITQRLVKLLYVRGRFDEAGEILRTTGSNLKGETMDKIRVATQVRTGSSDEAIAQAEALIEKNPDDVSNQLWLAALYNHASRADDAEKIYRKVIELDPKTPRHWLILVLHLANQKRLTDAEEALRQAREQLAPEDVPLTLAQGSEMLTETRDAERFYLEALEARPADLNVLRYTAQFFARTGRNQMASGYLDQILAKKVDEDQVEILRWARRLKAELLSKKGDYKSFVEAMKLLDANADDKGNLAPDDLMLKVTLLAGRPDRTSRNQAISLLAKIREKRALSPEEQFNLAQLYERAGNWSDARREMLELVTRTGNTENMQHIAVLAQMLVRHDDIQDAQNWFNKLVQLSPKSVAALDIRARLLAKSGKPEQAVELLEKTLAPETLTKAQSQNLEVLANMFQEMEQYPAAERALRRLYELEPRTSLKLAAFLGKHGNLDEAFDLMEQARKSQSLYEIIAAGSDSLRARQTEAGKQHYAKVEEWLTAGLADDPNSEAYQLQHAELMDLQGRYAEVESRYRQYIARPDIDEQRRAIAKNNLSFLLVLSGKQQNADEAVQLVNEAINVFGPTSDMLDTRGMAYYAKGDYRRAIAELRAAVDDAPSGVKFFHLALAQHKADEQGPAYESMKRALDLKLTESQLAKAERPWFQKLVKDLKLN